MKDLSKSALCYVLKKQVPKIGWNQFRWRILNLVLEIRIQLNSSFLQLFTDERKLFAQPEMK